MNDVATDALPTQRPRGRLLARVVRGLARLAFDTCGRVGAALVRRNLVETGRGLAQMMRLFAGRPLDLDELVDEDGFIEACAEHVARGHGLIIALPHLGNWELIAYRVTRAGPTTARYRPPRQSAWTT